MYDKLIDGTQLDADLTTVADAIRAKGDTTGQLSFPAGFVNAISAIQTGGGGAEEEEWPDDNNLHIWVNLYEGRLNPALSLGVNGTISIDWGDGSTETAKGSTTSTLIVVPHEYATKGEYHIIVSKSSGTYCTIFGNNYSCVLIRHSTIEPTSASTCEYSLTIKKIYIGNNFVTATGVGKKAFYNCYSLQSIVLPDNLTNVGEYAFADCYSLKNVEIPIGVTVISRGAFSYCYALQKATISGNVATINNDAFYMCTFLGKIRFERLTPATATNSDAFGRVPTDCIIEIPRGSFDAYRIATNYPNPSTYVYREV